MAFWFHQEIAENIGKSLTAAQTRAEPRLCCEVETSEPVKAIELIIQFIKNWNRQTVGCYFLRGSEWRLQGVNPSELREILVPAIETEEVISIFDFLLRGGCTLDFSPAESHQYELLFEAWGAYEEDASQLNGFLGGEETFRRR